MAESMIERVARAICAASGEAWREGKYELASGPNFEVQQHDADRHNNHWRHNARAAIEAMREPTDWVVDIMTDLPIDGPGYESFHPSMADCESLWAAGINAALAEQQS